MKRVFNVKKNLAVMRIIRVVRVLANVSNAKISSYDENVIDVDLSIFKYFDAD